MKTYEVNIPQNKGELIGLEGKIIRYKFHGCFRPYPADVLLYNLNSRSISLLHQFEIDRHPTMDYIDITKIPFGELEYDHDGIIPKRYRKCHGDGEPFTVSKEKTKTYEIRDKQYQSLKERLINIGLWTVPVRR
tara:strand:- start:422 stop:823 length:402 start_codon:yes stop_codon:yes gene_type:complete